MATIILGLAALLIALIIYLRKVYSSFEKHGIKHVKPLPIIGNMGPLLLGKNHILTEILNLYKAFPEERFVGRFEFLTPVIVARDLDLIKKITLKDVESFLDHRKMFEDSDSYYSRSLILLRGQEWKDMRSTLSPAFTSSKIRNMVPFMMEVGNQMIADLQQKINKTSSVSLDIDCRDLVSRYATDVIATCAFGVKVDSLADRNNEFYTMSKEITGISASKMMRIFLVTNFSTIAKLAKVDLMSGEARKFFETLVLGTMKERNQRNIIRPDMIHLLMETKKGKLTQSEEGVSTSDKASGFATVEESTVFKKKVNRDWSDNDLISQAVVFLTAGYETVTTAMSFLLHELAVNPEVQEKLAQEIKEQDIKNGGKFDLNSIQSMTYLDMVVSEILRKWPPGGALDRLCNLDYNMGKPNKNSTKEFTIRKGTVVMIPVQAIHHDPQYFPNPGRFDPERFSAENQDKIHPFAYMPFGVGPRNCIGSRFALCEIKVMTYQIIRHMEVAPCEKTCIPAVLDPTSYTLALKGGHWLSFKARS